MALNRTGIGGCFTKIFKKTCFFRLSQIRHLKIFKKTSRFSSSNLGAKLLKLLQIHAQKGFFLNELALRTQCILQSQVMSTVKAGSKPPDYESLHKIRNMKIMHIVGNRPQFIKLAMLCREMKRLDMPHIILHTGQHFDRNMSDIFFEQLQIPKPNYDLGINHLSHNAMIGSMLTKIDQIMALESPEMVVVYGDTNSTLAGALAAKKRNIHLAHIEAGVRTGEDEMPEEANRYLSDRMADLNFCCTDLTIQNLLKEGYSSALIGRKIFNSGDLMLDATQNYKDLAIQKSTILNDLGISEGFILATIHRAENTSNTEALFQIVTALNKIHEQSPVLFPMHPKTKKLITQHKIPMKFQVMEALGYLDMLSLTQRARMVITDSGGLCREAYFLQKPTLVIMRSPFWPEVFLNGPCLQTAAIESEILQKSQDLQHLQRIFKSDIFGDGHAAQKISVAIQNFQKAG